MPVRVQPGAPPGLLASRVYVDLVDVDEATARGRLLTAVAPPKQRPTIAPYPGGSGGTDARRFPGLGPQTSNLAARNRHVAGRAEPLNQLHARLLAGSTAAVLPTEAVHGLGGVGKTQLALEYAHRFGSDYELIWWVPADQPTSVIAALANLAGRLGIPQATDQIQVIDRLFDHLRGRGRWLLVYDNAERPDQLLGLLPPAGGGHVLVTSRWAAWGAQASPLPLGVLARAESLRFLRRRTSLPDLDGLDQLAELLGDLPLALEEAAAYLEQTQDTLPGYLDLVRQRARELFGLGATAGAEQNDQRRVATVWSVSLDRVRTEAPAAEALLNLCAFLAPELPRGLPTERPELLPEQLATAVGDRLSYNRLLGGVGSGIRWPPSPRPVSLCIGWCRPSSRPGSPPATNAGGPTPR